MTKKDYELIAEAFKSTITTIEMCATPATRKTQVNAVAFAAVEMANALARTNPRFDRVRFMKACGVK